MANQSDRVIILGVFVADLAFRAPRQPKIGETVLGSGFSLGPGGKGSNQAVAAARLGANVSFITKLGADEFGELGIKTWQEAGVDVHATRVDDDYTGAAYIYVDESSGDNAIIISPGAAATISPALLDAARDLFKNAAVFITQLEQPIAAAVRGLELAREHGVTTILNPAPAADLDDAIFALCDYITPNETEAEGITGVSVANVDQAREAAKVLLNKGVGTALITLGEAGALFHDGKESLLVPAFNAGPVVETTGAGDAFNGAFATALARGAQPLDAVRFGCAAAGISVTRKGTAPSMPNLSEVEEILRRGV